jgi:outer membrane protein X
LSQHFYYPGKNKDVFINITGINMKKALSLFFFIAASKLGMAQRYDREFKPFKIDVSAGYGMPSSTNTSGGVLFAFEPKYSLTGDQLSLGVRLEGALTKISSAIDTNVSEVSAEESASNISALLTCDYYFNNNNVRPFLGLGTGAYNIATYDRKSEGTLLPDITTSTKLGFMFRGGVEWNHLRAGIEYNLVNNSSEPFRYLGIKLGILLGGGRFDLISDN